MPSLSQIPLVRLIIPFILGILLGIYTPTHITFSSYFLVLVYMLLILVLTIKLINSNYKYRHLLGILIYFNLIAAGYCLTNLKSSTQDQISIHHEEKTCIGEVISSPLLKEKTIKIVLKLKGFRIGNKWSSSNVKVMTVIENDSLSQTLHLGDIIAFNSKLKTISPPKNPHEFNYKKYLSLQQIHQQSYIKFDEWKKIETKKRYNIYIVANKIREHLIKTLKNNGIADKELGVASALILGYKNSIDIQLKSAYANAGAMHILAVSGLHVGIIFMVFNYLLQFLGRLKYGHILKALLILVILWCYAFITGLSPSVLRASTMFSFIVVAKMTRRNANFFNTLAASAFFLLIINPYYLLDVGFQLSYIAVLGIVIIQPWLSNFYSPKHRLIKYFWGLTTVSIAAQISTLPLSLFYFHQFPNYFMVANIIVIPLAVFILYSGLLVLLFSSVPLLSKLLSYLLNESIRILNYAVNSINQLPHSTTDNIRFNIEDVLMVYLILLLIVLLFVYRKTKYLLVSQLLFVLFLINTGLNSYSQTMQRKIIIYNIPRYSAINFIDGKVNILVSDLNQPMDGSKLQYHVKNNWIAMGIKSEKIIELNKLKRTEPTLTPNPNLFVKLNYFQFYTKKIAIIDQHSIAIKTTKPLYIDLLIWTENSKLALSEIYENYAFNLLIIDSSNSTYTDKRLQSKADSLGINCWSIIDQGAFVLDL